MIGNNELRLNHATLCEAVQEWLDKRMVFPETSPRVQSVLSVVDSGCTMFTVRLSSPEKKL